MNADVELIRNGVDGDLQYLDTIFSGSMGMMARVWGGDLKRTEYLERNRLGPVDGFDQDEGGGEGDEGAEVCGRLFAAQSDAFEAFELPDGLFDAGPSPVERPCKALWPVFGVLSVGNDGQGASFPGELAVSGTVIALVGDDDAGRTSGPRSIRVSKCGLSAASPPVRSNAIGRPLKSVFRWIFVLKPPRERPSA